jgi:hypothetical protein
MILQTAAAPGFIRVASTMLGRKSSLAPLLALLRSEDVVAMAAASLPPACAPLAELLLQDEGERARTSAQWVAARRRVVQRGEAPDVFADPAAGASTSSPGGPAPVPGSAVAAAAEAAYGELLMDVMSRGRVPYPFVAQHEYTQGSQTRWALAWSFDAETCAALALLKARGFRTQLGEGFTCFGG